MTALFHFIHGEGPLLISVPHAGTHVPDALCARMTAAGRALPDTDWNIDRLYNFATDIGASLLVATHSRYVIDLNRPPDGKALYPGQRNTQLCPTHTFAGEAIWLEGEEPGAEETGDRRTLYWQPYHDRIAATLAAAKARHRHALLWDAHSIRGTIPALFEGRLPEFNIGTNDATTCDAAMAARLAALAHDSFYSAVLNGRFKGGYITRHYGRPLDGISAVQLELVQATYMDETPPWRFDDARAARVAPVIRKLVTHFAGSIS